MKICGVWVRSSTGDFSILRIWDVRTFDGHLAIFGHIRSKSTFPLNKHHLFRYHVFEILVQKSPPKISDSRSWMSASSRVMQEENGTLNKTHPARLVVAPMGGSGRLWIIGPKTDPLKPSWKSTKALSGRWRCCLIFTIFYVCRILTKTNHKLDDSSAPRQCTSGNYTAHPQKPTAFCVQNVKRTVSPLMMDGWGYICLETSKPLMGGFKSSRY